MICRYCVQGRERDRVCTVCSGSGHTPGTWRTRQGFSIPIPDLQDTYLVKILQMLKIQGEEIVKIKEAELLQAASMEIGPAGVTEREFNDLGKQGWRGIYAEVPDLEAEARKRKLEWEVPCSVTPRL